MHNRVVISGTVATAPQTRHSPGGIPITRFTLRHRSRQMEAGLPRQVECSLAVMACGNALQPAAEALEEGAMVTIHGFLSRADHRQGEARLVLHAESVEPCEVGR